MGKRSELSAEERRQIKNDNARRYRIEQKKEINARSRERYASDPERYRAEKRRSEANPEVRARGQERDRKRYERDRAAGIERERLRREQHGDSINEARRERWATDEEYRNAIYNRRKSRLKRDPVFRIACALRARLWHAIRNDQKTGSAVDDLGCTVPELIEYIEKQFLPGMTWDNWSKRGWHLDHKRALATFDLTDRAQFLEAVHYTNLQPLWAVDNMRKQHR